MVSCYSENQDIVLAQSAHLLAEEYACAVVFPVSIIEVACQQDESYFFLNGGVYKILECPSASISNGLHRR